MKSRWFVAAIVVLCLIVAGCTRSTSDPTANASARPYTGCNKVDCSGQLGGAKYMIQMPRVWNGTLLLYSHDLQSATPLPPEYATPPSAPITSPATVVTDQLLDSGYALAGSSWATAGWAVQDGIDAAEQLYEYFRSNIAKPSRVLVWGDSLGGLVTELIAERHPDWVSGSLPMCAPLAGVLRNQDLVFDVVFAVRTLIYPGMQLTRFTSAAGAKAVYDNAARRILAAAGNPAGAARLALIAALVDLPPRTGRYDGSTSRSRAAATIDGILTAVALGTVGRVALEQQIGGNPSGNEDTRYKTRITAQERAAIDRIYRRSTDAGLRALSTAPRITASVSARDAVERLGVPDGALHAPTLTLHTAVDPVVPVQNERVFGDVVSRSTRRTADLLQIYTQPPARYAGRAPYGAGHCNFTPAEQAGAVISLDRWVRTAQLPSIPSLTLLMSGGDLAYKGLNPVGKPGSLNPIYEPGVWPAAD